MCGHCGEGKCIALLWFSCEPAVLVSHLDARWSALIRTFAVNKAHHLQRFGDGMPDSPDWLEPRSGSLVICFAEIVRLLGPSRASQDRSHPPGLRRNPVALSSEEVFSVSSCLCPAKPEAAAASASLASLAFTGLGGGGWNARRCCPAKS